jgi:hypothetical protein
MNPWGVGGAADSLGRLETHPYLRDRTLWVRMLPPLVAAFGNKAQLRGRPDKGKRNPGESLTRKMTQASICSRKNEQKDELRGEEQDRMGLPRHGEASTLGL